MAEGSLLRALRSLCSADIEFVIVGGVAAALRGAPVHALEFGVAFSPEPENIERVLRWMEAADAVFLNQAERRLRPNRTHLDAGRHLNLLTRYGPVDLLRSIGDGLGFDRLLPLSTEMDLGGGMHVRVLNPETIIAIKEQLGSEKDLAALPTLRRTLRELRGGKA